MKKAGEVHGERVFLRYEHDDNIKEITFQKFMESCGAVAGWAEAAEIEDLEAAVWDIIQKHNQDLPSYKRILQCRVGYIPFEKTSSRKIIRGKYFEQKNHQKFGIDTDFYEAGLDSLGSILQSM